MNIWEQLPKPFFVLAPMDDVTDTVFRRVVAECARPDIMFTEFANADGLQSPGREAVLKKLRFYPEEQPLIAQIWGMSPENYEETAKELVKMGFDGMDINLGCPVPKIFKLGACSALMNNHDLARELILGAKRGLSGRLPLSVKTRIGVSDYDEDWIRFLLGYQLDALTIHGRTVKQMSKVPNDWAIIGKIKALRDEIAPKTKLVGNGDAISRQQGLQLTEQYGLDGIMIGRGIFQDPFIFADDSKVRPWNEVVSREKIELYVRHIELFAQEWGADKNPAVLKKFAKVYISGFEGASELRSELMSANSTDDLLLTLANN